MKSKRNEFFINAMKIHNVILIEIYCSFRENANNYVTLVV